MDIVYCAHGNHMAAREGGRLERSGRSHVKKFICAKCFARRKLERKAASK
jgi:hypothetical protein